MRNFETPLLFNNLVVVESLSESERHTGQYLVEDLEAEFAAAHLGLVLVTPRSALQLRQYLAQLTAQAAAGARPILHLEIHGLEGGTGLVLQPSGETLPWDEFAALCRTLNAATKNNLLVVMGVCHGFEAITAVDITKISPFCVMVGPTGVVSNGELLQTTNRFYRTLLESNDLSHALPMLPPSFAAYNSERLFVNGYTQYVTENEVGAARRRRLEELLTKAHALFPSIPIGWLRKWLRPKVVPSQERFTRYQERFLMSGEPENAGRFTVTLEDILSEIATAG